MNKELLFKDLCQRLPYNVYIKTKRFNFPVELRYISLDTIPDIKPYLRPMTDMSESEKKEMHDILSPEGTAIYTEEGIDIPMSHLGDNVPYEYMSRVIGYLNSHHFDYNGLINKGLALKAPDNMYNF